MFTNKLNRLEEEQGIYLKLIELSESEEEREIWETLAFSIQKKINKLKEKIKE